MPTTNRRTKLLFLVTEDWYFYSHRLALARAARDKGYDVLVVTRVTDHRARIEAEGLRLIHLDWRRRSIDPLHEARLLAEIQQIYRTERPDLVHHVAIKPVIYGGIAAMMTRIPTVVNAVNGLGFSFSSGGGWMRALRFGVSTALRLVLNRNNSFTIFQTEEDRDTLRGLGVLKNGRAVVIRGAGVDIDHFQPLAEPVDGPVRAAVVARMIRLKGIEILVDAFRIMRRRGSALELVLAGGPDPENPSSLSVDELRQWSGEPGISWVGHVEDVREVWHSSHIAVLPSLSGEGVPKSLLEAAACGRPLVATDIGGSRTIARSGRNGFVVPPGDAEGLAQTLEVLIGDAELRRDYGRESRRIVEAEFADTIIVGQTLDLYRAALQEAQLRAG